MAADAALQVACCPHGYVVCVAGRGTLQNATAFRDFVEHCLTNGQSVSVAMSQCTYLDSTFLGSLVALHKQGRRQQVGFTIVADDPTRQRLFAATMLHRVLDFRDSPPSDLSEFVELPVDACDLAQLGQILLSAHQQLAELGGPEAHRFRQIADQLRHELGPPGTHLE